MMCFDNGAIGNIDLQKLHKYCKDWNNKDQEKCTKFSSCLVCHRNHFSNIGFKDVIVRSEYRNLCMKLSLEAPDAILL